MGLLMLLVGIAGTAGAIELDRNPIPAIILAVLGFACAVLENYFYDGE